MKKIRLSADESMLLSEFYAAAGLEDIVSGKKPVEPVFTSSQLVVLGQLEDLAQAYFLGLGRDLPVRPRFNALVIAATGAGKTMLARDLARRTNSELVVISAGEWLVRGYLHETPSITALSRILERSSKTVLLLDELDKFISATDSGWVRSSAAEIWGLLDRRLPMGERFIKGAEGNERWDLIEDRLRNGLFIIGCGTFQSIWESSERRDCGFHASTVSKTSDVEILATIRSRGLVSPELLSRFSPRPLLLRYPTREEVTELLEKLGLNQLAEKAGTTIDPASISFEGVGMRVLEQLSAELLITRMNQDKRINEEILESRIVRRPRSSPGATETMP